MQQLIRLKNELDLSILVLAHTPKRATATPLTVNCLAGSKKLANFFDSIFAIGKDVSAGPAGRYVKQLKVRSAQLTYHAENVMRFKIDRREAMLQFVREEDNGVETELIGASASAGGVGGRGHNRCSGMEARLDSLRAEGKTLTEIAQLTGIPTATVGRWK